MKFRWIVISALSSYFLILSPYIFKIDLDPKLHPWLLRMVLVPAFLGGCALIVALIYVTLVWPLSRMIEEMEAGWSPGLSLSNHLIGPIFFFFFLLPIPFVKTAEGESDMLTLFAFAMFFACVLKFIAWGTVRNYRNHRTYMREYFACLHDPNRQFGETWEKQRHVSGGSKPKRNEEDRWPALPGEERKVRVTWTRQEEVR